jgi:hypothetical protein
MFFFILFIQNYEMHHFRMQKVATKVARKFAPAMDKAKKLHRYRLGTVALW